MPIISVALAGSLTASAVINIAEMPIRSVSVCAERAEIVRQSEFNITAEEHILRLHGDPDMKNVQFRLQSATVIPTTVESISPGEYSVKLGTHEDIHLVGELLYQSAGVKVTTITKIWLDNMKSTADIQTLALISQTTGTTWKKILFDYRSTCDGIVTDFQSTDAQENGTIKVLPPVLGYDKEKHPVITGFHQKDLDIVGTGKPVTIVLDKQTVNVEWKQRTDLSTGNLAFRYVVLPAGNKYGERMIIHDSNNRTFEVYGKIREGKLELPLGWIE